jgi:altronate hydrolase
MRKVLQLDARDNVLIALSDLKQGDVVEFNGSTYPLLSRVPAKHKFATEDLPVGTSIVMFGGCSGARR